MSHRRPGPAPRSPWRPQCQASKEGRRESQLKIAGFQEGDVEGRDVWRYYGYIYILYYIGMIIVMQILSYSSSLVWSVIKDFLTEPSNIEAFSCVVQGGFPRVSPDLKVGLFVKCKFALQRFLPNISPPHLVPRAPTSPKVRGWRLRAQQRAGFV